MSLKLWVYNVFFSVLSVSPRFPSPRRNTAGVPPPLPFAPAGAGSYLVRRASGPAGLRSLRRLVLPAMLTAALVIGAPAALAQAPPNDDFTNRIVLTGSDITTEGSDENASREPGEPLEANWGGESVWWTWTAPADGSLQVSVSNYSASEDQVLAIYTGGSLAELSPVASDTWFESPEGGPMAVQFNVTSGTSYQIAVAGQNGGTGAFDLNLLFTLFPPVITQQPYDRIVIEGESTSFQVAATGTAPLGYQWFFNETSALAGATSATLTLANVQSANAGDYSVVVTNLAGAVTSTVAALVVLVPPSIVSQPTNQTVVAGATASFQVGAAGTAPLSYRWFFNGEAIDGATTNSYSITDAQPSSSGGYSVVVSNLAGTATSAVGVLTIRPYVATATATVVNGFVVGATITDGGWGYTNTPPVMITGGGGTGAQAVAVVSNGVVLAVGILATGSGYTNAPAIFVAPPFIPQPTMGIEALSLLGFINLAAGTSYQLQNLAAGVWSDLGASLTAAGPDLTQYVGTALGYRLVSLPAPEQAYATAEVVNGFLVGATVTSGGSGYTTNPAVSIVSDGGGSNATAIATVSGRIVTGITITSTGGGYTNAPTIVIAPPPANALWPAVTQAMELDLGNLSFTAIYQLEFTPVLGGAWTNLGAPLTPTGPADTQFVNASGSAGFYRVKYVP